MLTKNGRKIFGSLFSNSDGASSNTTFSSLSLINQTGEPMSALLSSTSVVAKSVGYNRTTNCDINSLVKTSTSVVNLGVALGLNDDPETPSDYTLETTGLTGQSITLTKGQESFFLQATLSAYNGTDEAITVKEIGLYLQATSSAPENCLLYRKVLEAPVTVQPDETYVFSLIIK